MDLGYLRSHMGAPQLLGSLACTAGLLESPTPISARELVDEFSWQKLHKDSVIVQIDI